MFYKAFSLNKFAKYLLSGPGPQLSVLCGKGWNMSEQGGRPSSKGKYTCNVSESDSCCLPRLRFVGVSEKKAFDQLISTLRFMFCQESPSVILLLTAVVQELGH